jgi:hypothetical protein
MLTSPIFVPALSGMMVFFEKLTSPDLLLQYRALGSGFALCVHLTNWSLLGPSLHLYLRSPLNYLLGEEDTIATILFLRCKNDNLIFFTYRLGLSIIAARSPLYTHNILKKP